MGFYAPFARAICIFFVYLGFSNVISSPPVFCLSPYVFRISGTQFSGVFVCRSFVSLMVWQIFLEEKK